LDQAYGDRPLNVEHNVWKRVMRGLEKEGQAQRDEDLDDGIEEQDEEIENEYELEKGARDVEYVSDIEGESDDDMEDFEDWVGGQSADEEDGDSESASGSDVEEDASEDDDDDADADTDALKKTLANLKRKRPAAPPPKSKKKPAKGSKGPQREIEYEIEREPAVREAMRA
jgi:protein MAK16